MTITDCVAFVALAHELIDADESTWAREVHAHLAACPPCEIYLRQLEDLRTLLRGLDPAVARDDPRVVAALAALDTTPAPQTRSTP